MLKVEKLNLEMKYVDGSGEVPIPHPEIRIKVHVDWREKILRF